MNYKLISQLLVHVLDSVKLGDQKYVIKLAYSILDEANFVRFLDSITTGYEHIGEHHA